MPIRNNPTIPKLLEYLFDFKRNKPLTKEEYIQLFQINIWINKMIDSGNIPSEYANCIPEDILDKAEERYNEYDQPKFIGHTTKIAKQLLELRVTFRENQKIGNTYRVDIKLEESKTGVVLESDEMGADSYRGIDQLKKNWLLNDLGGDYKIKFIDVKKWKQME